jgi:hypothetical protein
MYSGYFFFLCSPGEAPVKKLLLKDLIGFRLNREYAGSHSLLPSLCIPSARQLLTQEGQPRNSPMTLHIACGKKGKDVHVLN